MIRHVWSVLCLKSVIDSESNNISLIDVLEQLNLVGLPLPSPEDRIVVPVQYEMVSLFTRDDDGQPARGEMRLTLFGPSGRALDEPNVVQIDLSVHERLRQRTRLAGLPIAGPGCYSFHVEYRNEGELPWQRAARVPVFVVIQTGQDPGREPATGSR